MGWGQLSKHVEAVADNEKGGADVLNQSLRDGLAKLNITSLYVASRRFQHGLFGYEKENEEDTVPNVYRGAYLLQVIL